MRNSLLGGLTDREFLARYWHKRPLLIRNAVPRFKDLLTPRRLRELAGREEVEARLVQRSIGGKAGPRWTLRHGPFAPADFSRLPATRWTLLAQGLNLHLPSAAKLLSRFDFIPHARLDDIMASFAVREGGVGPHFDSYDVFLLQGQGRRRWRVSSQRRRTLVAGAPLKILADFRPHREWILDTGDMLYLPPGYAHEGTALDACMTYSIGFRAPGVQELAEHFLAWLQDHVQLDGRYADPGLKPQKHPAEIGAAMLSQMQTLLARLRWSQRDTRCFFGEYLSTPKEGIFFSPPPRPLARAAFLAGARRRGVSLDAGTLLLFAGRRWFINGETLEPPAAARRILRALADARALDPGAALAPAADLLHDWYRLGYLHVSRHG